MDAQQSQGPDVVILTTKRLFLKLKAEGQVTNFLSVTKLLNYKFMSTPFLLWIANKLLFTILPLTTIQVKMFICLWNLVCYSNSNMALIQEVMNQQKIHILGNTVFCFQVQQYVSLIGQIMYRCSFLAGLSHNCPGM